MPRNQMSHKRRHLHRRKMNLSRISRLILPLHLLRLLLPRKRWFLPRLFRSSLPDPGLVDILLLAMGHLLLLLLLLSVRVLVNTKVTSIRSVTDLARADM